MVISSNVYQALRYGKNISVDTPVAVQNGDTLRVNVCAAESYNFKEIWSLTYGEQDIKVITVTVITSQAGSIYQLNPS
jgi:hypothetical protein